MSQYDAAATPMWECFTPTPNLNPFSAKPPSYNLGEMNTKVSAISQLSDEFNLEVMDAAPDYEFSEVIWKAVRGLDSVMPPPVRSAFVIPTPDGDED